MDIANCEVRLNGDLANSVPLSNVTPAETLILRAIHGHDSVVRFKQTGTDRRPHKDELDRLVAKYSEAKTEAGDLIIFKVFPNSFDPRLPVSFRDIGVDLVGSPDEPVADIPDLPEEEPKAEEESSEPVADEDETPRRGRSRAS